MRTSANLKAATPEAASTQAEAASTEHATARAATTLAFVSLASPIVGLAAEAALAWRFGTSGAMDAFRLAVTVPGFAQQLLVLQVLPNVVVPILVAYQARDAGAEGLQVIRALGRLVVLLGVVGSAITFALAGPLASLLAPGLSEAGRDATLSCLRAFAWMLTPIAAMSVASGILYSRSVFWPPIAAQIGSNLCLVAGVLLSPSPTDLGVVITAMVVGSVFNAVWVAFLARARHVDGSQPVRVSPFDHRVLDALRAAAPILTNVFVTQVLVVFFLSQLSHLPGGTVALFGYAWKIQQLVTLLPTVLATVMLPRFAAELTRKSDRRAGEVLSESTRMAWLVAMPLMAIAFCWREEIVDLAFRRGHFSATDGALCANLLGWLLLGMPALVIYTYQQQFLYAGRRGWWSPAAQLAGLVILVIGMPLMPTSAGATGPILLLVAGQWIGVWMLAAAARRLGGVTADRGSLAFFAATAATALAGAVAGRMFGSFVVMPIFPPPWGSFASLAVGGVLALAGYQAAALGFGWREGQRLAAFIEWRLRGPSVRRAVP